MFSFARELWFGGIIHAIIAPVQTNGWTVNDASQRR